MFVTLSLVLLLVYGVSGDRAIAIALILVGKPGLRTDAGGEKLPSRVTPRTP